MFDIEEEIAMSNEGLKLLLSDEDRLELIEYMRDLARPSSTTSTKKKELFYRDGDRIMQCCPSLDPQAYLTSPSLLGMGKPVILFTRDEIHEYANKKDPETEEEKLEMRRLWERQVIEAGKHNKLLNGGATATATDPTSERLIKRQRLMHPDCSPVLSKYE